ncbi:MAG: glycerophosphodiester phosphodiesterase family protein [Pseudomonadota bacterium]
MASRLTLTTPLIIGHRGAALHAPENTLAGIREAARQGATMVEFDATITGDTPPAVILFHDPTLERTTNGHGILDQTPLSTLRQLDAGQGEQIPTLAEAIALVQELGLLANVEIKVAPGRDRETAEAVMATLANHWPKAGVPPLISSFSVEALEIAKAQQPDWPRGYLFHTPPDDWAKTTARLDPATIHFNAARTTEASIEALKTSQKPLISFTVNDPKQALRLFDQGITGVFTDTPQTIIATLDGRGLTP